MTFQTQRSHVRQITFAATKNNGEDMIGVPQRFSRSRLPLTLGAQAGGSAQLADMREESYAIDTAICANTTIPLEDPLPHVAGVTAQLPLVYTPIGAKSLTPGWNFEIAPAA